MFYDLVGVSFFALYVRYYCLRFGNTYTISDSLASLVYEKFTFLAVCYFVDYWVFRAVLVGVTPSSKLASSPFLQL